MSAGQDGVWAANYEDGDISLIDPKTNEIAETVTVEEELGSAPSDLQALGRDVWLIGSDTNTIGHLDPESLEVTVVADVSPAGIVDVAVSPTHIWLAQHSGYRQITPTISHGVEVRSANAEVPPPGERYSIYSDIASGDAGVWALDESQGTVAAIAPAEGEPRIVTTNDEMFKGAQADIAVGHGYVWVETSTSGPLRLARLDPATGEVRTVELEGRGGIMVIGPDALWLLAERDEGALLWRVDPETLALAPPFELTGEFQVADMTYGFGSLWISHSTNLLSRVDVSGGEAPAHVAQPEQRGNADVCDVGGPWVDCPQARWLRRVIAAAGLEVTGDTGTALEVSAGSRRLYAWNTSAARPLEEVAADEGYERKDDTDVYSDGERMVWQAQGLHIYVSPADQEPIDDLSDDTIDELVKASQTIPMEADLSGAKPQPMPTAEQRFEDAPGGRVRVWPVTEDVPNEGKYLFTAPHCGLDWMLDFDGSFWDALRPSDYGNGENYSFFYNSDEGAITFTEDDSAVYQASTGEKIRLERLSGPIEVDPCA